MGGGLVAGIAVYAAAVLALRVPEAEQIRELVRARLRGGRREDGEDAP